MNLNPEYDFYPPEDYIYEPVFELNSIGGGGGEAEGMYNEANDKIAQGDYTGAKQNFQQLISQYPEIKFASASLKNIHSLEKYAGKDFSSLKTYFLTEPNLTNGDELQKLAAYLANWCNVELEDFPSAIAWFENVIQNPETLEDSIFAIIDLGYTYFIMENSGYKSAYVGKMIEHKPVSKEQFIENRNYLLSLIPGDRMSESMKRNIAKLKEGELLQNIPNPFKGSTQIWYKLENESNIQLNIYNYTGQLIKSIDEGTKTKGTHFIEFDATGLKNRIYFYSININGKTTDSKKMTIMK